MDNQYTTLEIEYHGQGLHFELPADATELIKYFKTRVPGVKQQDLLEMVDPETLEVVFVCRTSS